ncbi:MAG TPA: hypothetical protein VFX43_05485 [Chitinophagaceae bacterium]|nr:hypothetical protein [Chitinophagaceae bacterium]
MAIKYTQTTLDKIVKVLNETGYVLRFEKGTFNSGFCILEHKKVVVVNKFLNLEGRINTLMDILALLKIDENILSAESKKIYGQAVQEARDKTALPEEPADDPDKDDLPADDLAEDDRKEDDQETDETDNDDPAADDLISDDRKEGNPKTDAPENNDLDNDDQEKDNQQTP